MVKAVEFDGSDVVFQNEEDDTVLDGAEKNGYSIPYSCRKGVCASCLGDLVSGVVQERSKRIEGPAESVYFCQAKPVTDVAIRPTHWSAYDPSSRKVLDAKIKKVSWLTGDVAEVVLRFPIGVRAIFRAGQYLNVMIDGGSRSYSLANPPHKNTEAVLHVKKYEAGRFSDTFLSNVSPNQVVKVEVPFGDVELDPQSPERLLMLATGTGFAPVKSILESLVHLGSERPVHLFWGGRTEGDLYMAELMHAWADKYSWFSFTPVLSRPSEGWDGQTGWVQAAALERYPEVGDCTVYACGGNEMVAAARDSFISAGLDAQRFQSDSFVAAV
jgi:CDP-4-dehydro-6-deoxyglucose reductase